MQCNKICCTYIVHNILCWVYSIFLFICVCLCQSFYCSASFSVDCIVCSVLISTIFFVYFQAWRLRPHVNTHTHTPHTKYIEKHCDGVKRKDWKEVWMKFIRSILSLFILQYCWDCLLRTSLNETINYCTKLRLEIKPDIEDIKWLSGAGSTIFSRTNVKAAQKRKVHFAWSTREIFQNRKTEKGVEEGEEGKKKQLSLSQKENWN